jgi:hypothetical protein
MKKEHAKLEKTLAVIGGPTVGIHVLECSVGDLVQGLFDDFCEWDDDFALCGGVISLRVYGADETFHVRKYKLARVELR